MNDAFEGGELPELPELFSFVRAHHLEEGFDLLLRLLAALASELLSEHRGRCLRDGASASGKAHHFEAAIMHLRVDRHHVAAERIIHVFVDVGILQLAPVARALKVVENYLSVEALHHLAGNCIRSVRSFACCYIAEVRARGVGATPRVTPRDTQEKGSRLLWWGSRTTLARSSASGGGSIAEAKGWRFSLPSTSRCSRRLRGL